MPNIFGAAATVERAGKANKKAVAAERFPRQSFNAPDLVNTEVQPELVQPQTNFEPLSAEGSIDPEVVDAIVRSLMR